MRVFKSQEQEWRWEKAGWTFIGCILLIGLIGGLSTAPVSQGFARGIGLRADSKANTSRAVRLEVLIGPEATAENSVIVRIPCKALDNLEVVRILPAPLKVATSGDAYEYQFPVSRKEQPLTVVFHLKGGSTGQMPVRIGLPGAETLAFTQMFYP